MLGQKIPDFVIPGAAKSGTTTLAGYLEAHPEVSFASPKEPTLLMNHDYQHLNTSFKVPAKTRLELAYQRCFSGARPNTLLGEGSVAYFAAEESPGMVVARNPDVKAIFVLREPVSRTVSAYYYARSRFDEPASTFDQALGEELAGLRDAYWPTLRHLHYSKYVQHLERWERTLKQGNIMIIEFEALVRFPLETINSVCDFLGIANLPSLIGSASKTNATVVSSSPATKAIMHFLYQPSVPKAMLKLLIPPRIRRGLKLWTQDALAKDGKAGQEVSGYCKSVMEKEFAGMSEMLGCKFGFKPRYWNVGN